MERARARPGPPRRRRRTRCRRRTDRCHDRGNARDRRGRRRPRRQDPAARPSDRIDPTPAGIAGRGRDLCCCMPLFRCTDLRDSCRAAARRGGGRERERGRGRRDAGDARGAAEGRTVARTAETPVTVEDDDGSGGKMPLLDHLIELRSRLLKSLVAVAIAFGVCLYFARPIFGILVRPLLAAGQGKLIYTQLFEAFFVEIKVALFAAMMIAFPVIANQLWKFVAPGLYRKEKRALLPFLFATPDRKSTRLNSSH